MVRNKIGGCKQPTSIPQGGFAPRAFKKLDGYEPHKTNPKRKRDGKYHTPEHNGEVEGPHRIDQGKFYRYLTFYSLEDLRLQGARWNAKYNKTPRMTLKMKPPNQAEFKKLEKPMQDTGVVGRPKLLKCFRSFEN